MKTSAVPPGRCYRRRDSWSSVRLVTGPRPSLRSGRFARDVVLVDIQLPDLDGFAVAEQIAAWPDPPVVVLISSRDAAVYRSRLASTPARGFIAKSQLSGEALANLVA